MLFSCWESRDSSVRKQCGKERAAGLWSARWKRVEGFVGWGCACWTLSFSVSTVWQLGSQVRRRWQGIQWLSIHTDSRARRSGRMWISCNGGCFFPAPIAPFMRSHVLRHISQKLQQLGVNQSHCSALIMCSAVSVSANIQIMKFSFITFLAMFAVQNYGTWIRACVYEKRQEWLIFMWAWIKPVFLILWQLIKSGQWQIRAETSN